MGTECTSSSIKMSHSAPISQYINEMCCLQYQNVKLVTLLFAITMLHTKKCRVLFSAVTEFLGDWVQLKHEKAVIRWKGQVREVRRPTSASYGGESTGIRTNLSRSVRFKN